MAENPNHRGTDNVLADLGFPDAEALTAKTVLAKKINDVIDSGSDAAKLLGMPQAKVLAIRNYKLRGISLARLTRALTALRQHVGILATEQAPPRIDLTA